MSLKYEIKVTIQRNYGSLYHEEVFLVYNPEKSKTDDQTDASIKLEVGIEECLHIQFEYSKTKYHLKDCVLGKVDFNLVRIKIRHMELAIVRKETVG